MTRRARTSLLRRIVMWAAGVVLAMSLLAWGVSLWGVTWTSADGAGVLLWYSAALIYSGGEGDFGFPAGWAVEGLAWHVQWWPEYIVAHDPSIGWFVWIPLWVPTAGAAVTLGATRLTNRKRRARLRMGHCPTCGYDLTGITGPCPECGSKE